MSKNFVFLEKVKTWRYIDEGMMKIRQCADCGDFCNAQSFKATHYTRQLKDGPTKEEFLCRKHAMKRYPNYFK